MLAIFVNGDLSMTAIFSLISSIMTSAFISAEMSYDWDTSEDQRKKNPKFYYHVSETIGWIAKQLAASQAQHCGGQ